MMHFQSFEAIFALSYCFCKTKSIHFMKTVLIFGKHFAITSILGWLALLMIASTWLIDVPWMEFTISGIALLMVIIAILVVEFKK